MFFTVDLQNFSEWLPGVLPKLNYDTQTTRCDILHKNIPFILCCVEDRHVLFFNLGLKLDSFLFLDGRGYLPGRKIQFNFFLTQMTGETRDNNTNQSS